jgi:hypothetical protein
MTLPDFIQAHAEHRAYCEGRLTEFAECTAQLVGITCSDGVSGFRVRVQG